MPFLAHRSSPSALLVVGALVLGGTQLLAVPAAAYKVSDDLWDVSKGPVKFHMDPIGSDNIDDGSEFDAIRDAYRDWECVDGVSIRFDEGTEAGVREVNFDDGINTHYFAETEAEARAVQMGPSTLGITIGRGLADGAIVRDAADIIFNGFDHDWSTDGTPGTSDVKEVALHEGGHLLGMLHPCEDAAETDCLPPEESIMAPAGVSGASLKEDDKNGIRAIYPAVDESRCTGPYRIGETCAHDCECITGLKCVPGLDDAQVCSPDCSADNAICPVGFACILGAQPATGDPARGTCFKIPDEQRLPPAAICSRTSDCEAGTCIAVGAIGRTVCRFTCDAVEDCPTGYNCTEGVCVGKGEAAGIECPVDEEPEPGCGCAASPQTNSAAPFGLALLAVVGVVVVRRRRRHATR